MQIPIIYEDQNIVAINKPAGLLVHSNGKTKEKTLVDWLVKKYPQLKKVGDEPETRPGLVHRLDKDTSGVLLIAKNQKTFEELKKQFQEKQIQKIYLALVWGEVKKEKGVVSASIGRSAKFGRFIASRGKRGKIREAVTEYKVLKRFLQFTFLELKPKTGRTHQLRVHMKFLNHPIVCDKLYAPNRPCPVLGLGRLALHAQAIEFTLSQKKMRLEASLPADFKRALASLK